MSSTSIDVNRLHTSLHSHLQSKGLDPKAAASWSLLSIEVHNFAQKSPHIQAAVKKITVENGITLWDIKGISEDVGKIYRAGVYGVRAESLGLSVGRWVSYGFEGSAGIANVVLDLFGSKMKKDGLDPRGLALAALCFGLAASGAGEVLLGFALVIDILANGYAGYSLGNAMLGKE
jgi:hypothetical protein